MNVYGPVSGLVSGPITALAATLQFLRPPVARSATSLLAVLGISGPSLRQVDCNMSLGAERASEWLWVNRKHTSWGAS